MEILNNFAKMQTKDNFVKTIEIRKDDSFDNLFNCQSEHWQDLNGCGAERYNHCNCPHPEINYGTFTVNMKIIDWHSDNDCSRAQTEEQQCICDSPDNYKLVFNGYQRIKVTELLEWLDLIKKYAYENEYTIEDSISSELQQIEDNNDIKFPIWFIDNLSWLMENVVYGQENIDGTEFDLLIFPNIEFLEKYLKDEEYCIVYFIDKEKTFNTNGWEKE